jgi:hypothetical protein
MAGLCGTRLCDADGFAVDGTDDALPAGQSFLEAEVDGCNKVVTLNLEVWVVKL